MRREFELVCPDGVKLYAWAFEAEHPRAAICVAHGLGEHGDRYAKFAQAMNQDGISVYVHDHRGHGRNVKKKSDRGVARMRDLERDHVTMIEKVRKETGLPVFLFGHSLGGCIGLFTALNAQPELAGVIITSPWLKLVNPPPKALFSIVSEIAGAVNRITIPNGIPASALCHDAAVCAAYEADVLNHDCIGLGLAGDANRAAQWILDHPERLRAPLLLCHGAEDPVCSVEGSHAFAAKASGVRFVEFPNAYHEIHNEPADSAKLFETELAFIHEVLGAEV